MKISDIQFEVRSFRFEEPMRVAFATITEMETCIVRVITDEGLTGYGEAAPFPYVTGDTLETVMAVGSDLKKSLIGLDPRAIGMIHRVMDSRYAGNKNGMVDLHELYRYIAGVGDHFNASDGTYFYHQHVEVYPSDVRYAMFK